MDRSISNGAKIQNIQVTFRSVSDTHLPNSMNCRRKEVKHKIIIANFNKSRCRYFVELIS